jgi:signal transduction histidine kinase
LVRLLVEATAAPGVGDLSATLGAALRDPTARLLYPVTDGRLVDANGAPVEPPTALTRLHRGQTTIAYLAHDAGSLDAGPILEEITRATRLTLDNERLHAEHTWQLRQLQDSRRRIVAAADRERRTLERDLHDGAQQNLVALALTLSLAEINSDSADRISALQMAGRDVTQALVELRTIARGIYPRELGDEGLDVALEMLAESAVSPIILDVDIPSRLPATVESAAYFAIRQYFDPQVDSVAGPAALTVRRSAAWLSIDIHTPTPPDNMLAIEDRVGALGGTLTIQPSANAGARAHLELPCES